MRRIEHVSFLLVVTCALVGSGCDRPADTSRSTPSNASQTRAADRSLSPGAERADGRAASAARERIDKLDQTIEWSKQRVARADAPSWIDLQRIGRAYLTRARLSGSYDDYEQAERALVRADELAPTLSGPKHELVRLNYALHRFDEVEPILEIIEHRPLVTEDSPGAHSIRGDLSFQRGNLEEALVHYRKAYERAPSAETAVRIAHYRFKTGQIDAARAGYAEAIELGRSRDRLTRAWLRLQRGIFLLEQSQLGDAYAEFDAADDILSGWYVIEEHMAEVHARRGEYRQAAQIYEDVVARVPRGEFMEALADVYEEQGRHDRATDLRKRARRTFERTIAHFPHAASGHALEHFLRGDQAERAVALARENFRVRPNPEAAIKLAQARVRGGDIDKARALIEIVLDSPWDTAELHATAARIYRLLDEPAKAKRHRQRAAKLHPAAYEALEWLSPVVERADLQFEGADQ